MQTGHSIHTRFQVQAHAADVLRFGRCQRLYGANRQTFSRGTVLQAEYFKLVSILTKAQRDTDGLELQDPQLADIADDPAEAAAMQIVEESLRQDITSGRAELRDTGG